MPTTDTRSGPGWPAARDEAGRRSAIAAGLIASARGSLDHDPDAAHGYLGRLAAMLLDAAPATACERPLLARISASGRPSAKGGLAAWQFRRVVEHVEQGLGETIVIETLAAETRLSSGHFCRAFKVTAGETPHSFLIRQRVRRAQQLMLETNGSLSQISSRCGFTDQAHLARLFRRMTGETPLLWRRTWQQPAPADQPRGFVN